MEKCIFCAIASKEAAANVVFEDDECMAFLDIDPLFKGHCLLVPKKHVYTVMDVPDTLLSHLCNVSKKISIALKEAMHCDGVLILNNNVVSQSVPHFHIQIIPRNKGDGLRGFLWPRHGYESDAEAASIGKRIRSIIEREQIRS